MSSSWLITVGAYRFAIRDSGIPVDVAHYPKPTSPRLAVVRRAATPAKRPGDHRGFGAGLFRAEILHALTVPQRQRCALGKLRELTSESVEADFLYQSQRADE
jgi:hypothetical protein